jgi:predicted TIM-barrel fold metal-dependent hydrolase
MYDNNFVIDAVGHSYDTRADNRRDDVPVEVYDGYISWLYGYGHSPLESKSGDYMLTRDEWAGGWTNEELLRLFFVESAADMVVIHDVNFYNFFKRGANPWPQSLELKKAAPGRIALYAAVDPLADRSAQLEHMAEAAEAGVSGFKFYPVSGLTDEKNHAIAYSFGEEKIQEYFDYARSLGINHIAIHKAMPTAAGPNEQDRPNDVNAAAATFPDMTFEVVHSGWAFLEDCAAQLTMNPNVYANLELTANAIVRMPRRFARAVGTLLAEAPKQVIFATGAPLTHPQPIIEAIANFSMPEDLQEEGLPEFTAEIKSDLLSGTWARLQGIDIHERQVLLADDEFARARTEYLASAPSPWALKRARRASELNRAAS